jgi:hypothetical protein
MDFDFDDEDQLPDGDVVVMGLWTRPEAIDVLEDALHQQPHLQPLWERIVVLVEEGRALIGLPITSKVTDETCDNHARHLHSLLRMLGLPLVKSPMALERIQVTDADLRPLNYEPPEREKK